MSGWSGWLRGMRPGIWCGLWLALWGAVWVGEVAGQSPGGAPPSSPPAAGGVPGSGGSGAGASGGSAPGAGAPTAGRKKRTYGKRRKGAKKDDDYLKVLSETNFAVWGKQVHDQMKNALAPFLKRHLELLLPPFQTLGWLVLAFMFLLALVTMANENQSAAGLGGLMIRGVFCAFLVGWSGPLVDRMVRIGGFWVPVDAASFQQVAQTTPGPGGRVRDVLFGQGKNVLMTALEWRNSECRKYFEGYEALVQHGFRVDVSGSQVWRAYKPDLKFVIPDFGRDGRDRAMEYTRRLNLSRWSPSDLLGLLNGSVTVMHLGMMFSTVLMSFLLIAFKLLSPVFFGIAVNKKFAGQLTSPFVRGLLVATLLLPTINLVLEGLTYAIARLGFAPFYLQRGGQWQPAVTWDDASLSFVGNFSSIAPYIFMASFLTAVAGLCMILSPVIAYKIAQGEWFSSAVGSVSGWTAGLIGMGMASFSTAIGSLFQREAEHFQNIGVAEQRKAEAKAGQVMGLTENRIQQQRAVTSATQRLLQSYSQATGNQYPWSGGVAGLVMQNMYFNHADYRRGMDLGNLIATRVRALHDSNPDNDPSFQELSHLSYLAQANSATSPIFRLGLETALQEQSQKLGFNLAQKVRDMRAAAIDQAAALRMGGAATNLRYAQMAAERQALGSYVRVLDTFNDVLMEQIENNQRV